MVPRIPPPEVRVRRARAIRDVQFGNRPKLPGKWHEGPGSSWFGVRLLVFGKLHIHPVSFWIGRDSVPFVGSRVFLEAKVHHQVFLGQFVSRK